LSQKVEKKLVGNGVVPICKLRGVTGRLVGVVATDFIGITPAN